MAACRAGDTLVVTKLDRLGGAVHDPNAPVGRLLFNVLAMVAEFEGDLIRLRTREGMKVGWFGEPSRDGAPCGRTGTADPGRLQRQ